jgi:hypothetical protein
MYAPEAEPMSRERGENCSAICDRRECIYANLNFGAHRAPLQYVRRALAFLRCLFFWLTF